jgi:hypothetical protein
MENKNRIRKKEGIDIIDANSGPCRGLKAFAYTPPAFFRLGSAVIHVKWGKYMAYDIFEQSSSLAIAGFDNHYVSIQSPLSKKRG